MTWRRGNNIAVAAQEFGVNTADLKDAKACLRQFAASFQPSKPSSRRRYCNITFLSVFQESRLATTQARVPQPSTRTWRRSGIDEVVQESGLVRRFSFLRPTVS